MFVQSHICDKKLKLEIEKLVKQAKNIAKPRQEKTQVNEISLYNSMVLGIQNYYRLATNISVDCKKIQRSVMQVLTPRLNTETGSRLLREGGSLTKAEKERFGSSKMIRFVSGVEQPIYPIAFIKHKSPMAKRTSICSYTPQGREKLHDNLAFDITLLKELREEWINDKTVEYTDNRLSLFSAQWGKCYITGEKFLSLDDIVVYHKKSLDNGGTDKYRNLVLINRNAYQLLKMVNTENYKSLTKSLNLNKKQVQKLNELVKLSYK